MSPPGGEAGSGTGSTPFEATVTELEPGATYHYRMVGENFHGKSFGQDVTFMTNDKPTILNDTVSQVNTDGAILQAEINANALETTYHFEYGPEPCSISACTSGPTGMLFDNLVPKPVSLQRSGLNPGETVYFRVIAQNSRGTVTGEDRHFTTYVPDPGVDLCDNSQVRQQTTAALLLDCRAYELVSAAKAGGYDVESDLVAGPAAAGRLPGRAGPRPLLDAPGLDPRHRRQPDQLRTRPVRRDPRDATAGRPAMSACRPTG